MPTVVHTYTTGTAATETVPAGATSVAIQLVGGGGGGAAATAVVGGGGGGGAYCAQSALACTAGQTFTYTVGVGGHTVAPITAGVAGTASTVSGTVSGGSVSLSAGGGGGGAATGAGGAGGTASGGTTNTAGTNGASGAGGAQGGAGGAPLGGAGGSGGAAGTAPGGGGGGIEGSTSGAGAAGTIIFTYTIATGQIAESTSPTFISEDTNYSQYRSEANNRQLMFGRPNTQPGGRNLMNLAAKSRAPGWTHFVDPFVSVYSVTEAWAVPTQAPNVVGQPFFLMQSRRPPPFLFEDPFVMAYSVQMVTSDEAVTPGSTSRSLLLFYRASIRLPEVEDEYKRFNHQQFFQLRGPYVAQLIGYTFDQPDFNDDPWLEQVHRPTSPEALLFPFRQIPQAAPPSSQYNLYFWQSPNYRLEAEEYRVSSALPYPLLVFGRPPIATVIVPNVVGLALAAAALALNAVTLAVGAITEAYSNTVPFGAVISQSPPAGTIVLPGTGVNLLLSLGPAPSISTVPNVVGLYYYDAQLAILQAGLLIEDPIWALSSTVLPQYVMSQSLVAGTEVSPQTPMSITVSGFPVTQQPNTIIPVP